ncbi:MAG TPA: hypothetical protein VEZ40_11600 [Pyrinomonadaceae bacterium]|nr:hypothetical protein [Pyrinomonadaceae bacterium]
MTPEEHNKALGICHLAYGGLSALMVLVAALFFGAVMFAIPGGDAPVGLFMILLTFILLWSFVLMLPSFIAGYAILKHKSWAKPASIVAAVLETMSFPLGTAVAIYSFWFMFSDAGRAMYDKNITSPQRPYALRDAPPAPASEWGARSSHEREREYVPPAQPPDWRGE